MALAEATIDSSTDNGHYSIWDSTLAHDGNLSAKYYSPDPYAGYGVTHLDFVLDQIRRVGRIRRYVSDYPGKWMLESSDDGITYTPVDDGYVIGLGGGWTDYDFAYTDSKYWRLRSFYTPAQYRLHEIQLWYDDGATLGSGNPFEVAGDHRIFPKAMTSTDAYSDSTSERFQADGSDITYFASAALTGSIGDIIIEQDFGKPYPVYKWMWPDIPGWSYDLKLQYSTDAVEWTDATDSITAPVAETITTTFTAIWAQYWRVINTTTFTGNPRIYETGLYIDGDTYAAGAPAAGGGTLGTVEYGDTLLKALQTAGATSKEVVGALNELNGTSGVEFDLAYRTYIA